MKAERAVMDVLNSEAYGILTVLMDWVSNKHLSKLRIQEERRDNQKPQSTGITSIQEKCLKVKGFQFALVNMFSHLFS